MQPPPVSLGATRVHVPRPPKFPSEPTASHCPAAAAIPPTMNLRIQQLGSVRTYATRIAERPKFRHSDPLINSPTAKVTQHLDGVTFIQRPPPTAPSPHSLTPAPASPLLRRPTTTPPSTSSPLLSSSPTTQADGASLEGDGATDGSVPIPLSKDRNFSYLSAEQIEEMRALRLKDPAVWTRLRLARHFGCSPAFVGMFARLKKAEIRAQKTKFDAQIAAGRAKWGEKKELAAAIRKKRREFW